MAKIVLLFLMMFPFFLAGCAPRSIIDISATTGIINISYVKKAEDGIETAFTTMYCSKEWKPWPFRSNTRQGETLRYIAVTEGGFRVEKSDAPGYLGLYEGNTSVGHADPPWRDLMEDPVKWDLVGFTTDRCPQDGGSAASCYYVKLWEYIVVNYDLDFAAPPGTAMPLKKR